MTDSPASLLDRIEAALGTRVESLSRLSGGCVGDVRRADLAGGGRVVVKSGGPSLDIEGRMLAYLSEHSPLPVPGVLAAEPDLLILEHIDHDARRSDAGELAAADLLADCHDVAGESYGLAFDTLIGPLDQPNQPSESWIEFYRDRRLLPFAAEAARRGGLSPVEQDAVRRVADHLKSLIGEPNPPGLIHGDVWGGNVLWDKGEVRALVDPAVYYADPEVELAFIDLFSCFGRSFSDRYRDRRPVRPGYEEIRRPLYQLYPLLVHAALFGGGYGSQAAGIAQSLGRRV